ncbi:MAG: class I SAM-dependent methyltransferase [bacterium]
MFYFHGSRKPDFTNIIRNNYDDYWEKRGFKLRDKLLEREEIFFKWINPKSSVIDIGCGNSRLLFELKNKKACEVCGIDISHLVIDELNKIGINSKVSNIESDDFNIDKQFDYLIISEVLEHLRYPEDLILKLKKQAKYLLISIPNSAFYRYRFGLMFKGRFFTQWREHPSEHLRYWSHRDFLDWLNAMGFELIRYQSSNGFLFKDIFVNLFGHQICYLVKSKCSLR